MIISTLTSTIQFSFFQDTLQFTSPYQGKAVAALAGSSVNFTWRFPSDITVAEWGVKQDGVNDFISGHILESFDSNGQQQPVLLPSAYSGRVSGSRSGGLAIFTLSSIRKSDGIFYGCKITKGTGAFVQRAFDAVQLLVKGK